MRTEIILKIYNTLVLPTFLYGSENWTLIASQRKRIEAAEMKLLRSLAGYTLYDHKTNDYIPHKLQITGILDKINEYRQNWFQHLQRMPQNQIPLKSYYYRPQGRRTNWKTEETLERAAVTLETVRIKGSNPWCLWWWQKFSSYLTENIHCLQYKTNTFHSSHQIVSIYRENNRKHVSTPYGKTARVRKVVHIFTTGFWTVVGMS